MHILQQEDAIKDHHIHKFIIADSCYNIFRVDATGGAGNGEDPFMYLLRATLVDLLFLKPHPRV
jgi:hypothetical protein